MKNIFIPFLLLALFYCGTLSASNYIWKGTISSNWNDAQNWSPVGIPSSTDSVTITKTGSNNLSIETSPTVANFIISSGNTVTLSVNNSLTVNGNFNNSGTFTGASASTLYFGGTASISGSNISLYNLIVNSSATLSSTGTFSIAGAFSNSGTFTASSGTVTFNGSSAQTMAAGTFSGLNINTSNSATVSMTGKVMVNGQLDMIGSTGNLLIGANVLTLSGSGIAYSGAHIDATNVNATVVVSGSMLFSGGGFLSSTISNLTINNNAYVTSHSVTINGLLTISSGAILNMGTYALTAGTPFFSTSGTGTLQTQYIYASAIPSPCHYSFTVEYNSTFAAQVLPSGCTFANLTLSNTYAAVTVTGGVSGSVTVIGVLTISPSDTLNMGTSVLNGSFTTSGTGVLQTQNTTSKPIFSGRTFTFDVLYNSTSAQTVVGGNYYNLNIAGGNRTLDSSTGTIAVANTYNQGAGTLTTKGSTLSLATTYNLPSSTYGSLIVAGGTISAPSSLTLTGSLTVNSNATFIAPSGTLSIPGSFVCNGTFNPNNGNVNFNGATSQTMPALSFNGVTISNSAGVALGGNDTLNGGLTLTSGTLTIGANNLTLAGGVVSYTSGRINATDLGATIIVSASISLSITTFSGSINNLTVNNKATLMAQGNYTINGVLNIENGSVLSLSNSLAAGTNFSTSGTGKLQTQSTSSTPIPSNYAYSFTVELNSSVAAQSLPKTCTFNNLIISNTSGVNETYGATSTVTINGQLTINSGCTLNMGTANLLRSFTTSGTGILKTSGTLYAGNTYSFEVDYTSGFYQTVANGNYANLNITGGGRNLSGSGIIAVAGFFTAADTAIISTNSTLSLSNTQSLPSFTYNNLIIAAGNITVSSSIKLTGNLIINNGATFTAPADTLTIAGNFSDSGTFNHNGGTVIFNGVNQVLYGATTFNTFYKLVTTAATLTFPSGKIQTFLNKLTLIGAWQNLLTINASVVGQQALLASTPTLDSLSYLFVTDIKNTNASNIIAMNSTDNGDNTHIIFTPATDALADSIVSNLITNPEMAFYEWNLYQQAPVKSVNNYCRYTWSQLEPTKGNYDFSLIIAAATAAYNNPKGRGKLSFGVRCLVAGDNKDYPTYLDNPTNSISSWYSNAKKSWVPDWNNAYFLERLDSLVAAMGRAFNNDPRIGFVQILSYGDWGEWHMAAFEAPVSPNVTITHTTIEHMINAYTSSFPNKQLLMMTDNSYGLQYAMTRTNVAYPIGWYRCSWGNNDMYQMTDSSGWSYAKDRWKTAPAIFEGYGTTTGSGMNYALCIPQTQQFHVSAIGDWLYGTYATMTQAQRDSVLMSVNLAGYKYVLRSLNLSDSLYVGRNFTVTSKWSNTGQAPTYLNWVINYRFIDSVSGQVKWQNISQLKLKTLLPTYDSATQSDTAITITDHFAIPTNVNSGNYKLEVLITDSANYYAPLQLLTRSRNTDSGYTVLSLKVYGTSAVPPAPASITATAKNAQVLIGYAAPISNGSPAVIDYTITAIPSSGSTIVRTGVTANPYTFVGLTNNTTYSFTIAARNSVGAGSTITSNPVTPSSTTIWNGTTWSAGIPDATQLAVIAAPYNSSTSFTCTNLTVYTGVSFVNNSTVTVTNSPDTINGTVSGSGTVVLAGSSAQTIAGTGIVSNLTLNNATGVSVSGSLGITGVLNLQTGTLATNGNVTLKSTSITNSGILGPIGAGGNSGSINGNITVERYIPKGFRAFRDLCANGVYNPSNTLFNTWQESGSYTNNGYGMFITGILDTTVKHNLVDVSTGIDHSLTGYPSAYYYNNGWNTITNTRTTYLNPFQSFRILIRGDRSFDLDTTPVQMVTGPTVLAMHNATTLRAIGVPVTGDVTFRTSGITNAVTGATYNASAYGLNSSSTGYTYLANPYPCPINFDSIYKSSSNIKASYYYLDPTMGSTGGYVSYNASSAVSSNGAVYGKYIQAGQGFLIGNNNSTSPVVVVKESFKATGATVRTAVFGTTIPQKSLLGLSLLKQIGTAISKMDAAIIVFGTQFSNGLSKEDNTKFTNASDNLSITEGGNSFSIDGRLPATNNDTLGINLGQMSGNQYELVLDASSYLENKLAPYLVDAYLKKIISLSIGIDTVAFTVDTTNAATYQNRFSIVFKPTMLSVKSIEVTASLMGNIAIVKWNTVGENGVVSYYVEKSTDGVTFNKIGEEAAENKATATYSDKDNNVIETINYYRVKAVCADGSIAYSNIVKLTTNHLPLTTIYPNPLTGNTLNVQLNNVEVGKYVVIIYNSIGQKVAEQSVTASNGSNTANINMSEEVPVGVYHLVLHRLLDNKIVFESSLIKGK